MVVILKDTETTEKYTYGHTLALNDELPICSRLAAEVGAKADLLDVALRSVNAELALPAGVEQVEMDVSWETSFERRANSLVEYRHRVAGRGATGTLFLRGALALIEEMKATSEFSDDRKNVGEGQRVGES